jgi:calcineurin-like phosphoesterase family protein
MRRLNFKHFHFIKGNHDKPFIDWHHNFGNEELARKVTVYPHFLETKIEGHQFVLCHYAMATFNRKNHNAIHLCGHSHYTLSAARKDGKELGKVLDVGVDGNNFYPYSFDEIIRIMNTKPTFSTLPCFSDHQHN